MAQVGQLAVLAFDGQVVFGLAHQGVGGDLARVAQFGLQAFDLFVALGEDFQRLVAGGGDGVAFGFELGAGVEQGVEVAAGLLQPGAVGGARLVRVLPGPTGQRGHQLGRHFRRRHRRRLRLRTAPGRQVLVQADRRRLAQSGADGLDGDRLTVALQAGGRCRDRVEGDACTCHDLLRIR